MLIRSREPGRTPESSHEGVPGPQRPDPVSDTDDWSRTL